MIKRHLAMACVMSLAYASALGDVKLSSMFSDDMVLQQGKAVPVWGTAEPGEQVTVTAGEAKSSVAADKDGKWMVKIGPLKAGGPIEVTVAGKNTITLKNVLVGEVWVCSGQSNMQFGLGGSNNGKQEVADANWPEIRLYQVPNKTFATPQTDVPSKWVVCEPNKVGGFTAVGYFFGRDLHQKLNVPIGLIGCAWGGMPAQTYTPRDAMEQDPRFKSIVDGFRKQVEDYPAALAKFEENKPSLTEKYQQDLEKWKAATQAAEPTKLDTRKNPAPKPPQAPQDPALNQANPGVLWDSMIYPQLPYGIAGAIWYQGESDAGRAYLYRDLFPFMIEQWRKGYQQDVPFFWVQLANFDPTTPFLTDANAGSNWAELREAQSMALSLPKTGMAVIIDIGHPTNIHPTNKQDVGKRLALNALKVVYGKDIVYASPMYDSMKVEGNKVVLKFKNPGSGLVAKPVDANVIQGSGELRWFAVAGADQKFVWASAKIQGNDTVVVSSDQVANPVAVRYAWAGNPDGCNLYNKEGLPASPFRTDDWPGVTAPKAPAAADSRPVPTR